MMRFKIEVKGRTFATNEHDGGLFELVRGAYVQHCGTSQTPIFSNEAQFRRYVQRALRETKGSSLYFVVPAPGHYGDETRVLSNHWSLASAKKAAGPGFVVREGHKRRGETFFRCTEALYPVCRDPA